MPEWFSTAASVLQKLDVAVLGSPENFYIKRDDLIHPVVSGNKWRKLKGHLKDATGKGCNHLVTYGGAYSNHMIAVACAAAVAGMKSSCFIRGHELEGSENHYLRLAKLYGMNLIPVSREIYRDKKEEIFNEYFGNDVSAYRVSEGGAGEFGETGVMEIVSELDQVPDVLIHASATATTARGLSRGFAENEKFKKTRLKSVAVLLNAEEQISALQNLNAPDALLQGYEFGGYAKTNAELMYFIRQFIKETGILIDPVYTGKALFALKEMIKKNEIGKSEKIIFLHTGGMLGLFSDRFFGGQKL